MVHKHVGICRIRSVSELNMSHDGPRRYYVLTPLYDQGTTLYTPCDQAEHQLRDPLNREDIDSLIDGMPRHHTDWISDEKARQRYLTGIVRSGNHENLLAAVSALYDKRKEQTARGRKFHSSDARFLEEAETSINREFAYVLGVQPDDVPAYIRKRLKELRTAKA